MQMAIRRASERGHADHGWLDTHHTFSFAGYYDPRFMGFSHLRVINQDRVAPGRGFPTHPHRNMEIISYVVQGALAHKDTLGTGSVIRPGEVQVMSAGRGIAHSEMNASRSDPVHFLQIWLLPAEGDTPPRYDQRDFGTEVDGVRLVVSPDGRDGSLRIGQDTDVYRARLAAHASHALPLRHDKAWVQVIEGSVGVNGALLHPGDGLAVVEANHLDIRTPDEGDGAHALIFDLR